MDFSTFWGHTSTCAGKTSVTVISLVPSEKGAIQC